MTELTVNYETGTRDGAEIFDFSKSLAAGHYINDGVSTDSENVLPFDEVGTLSTRTVPYLDVGKALNTTTFNYDNVLDNNSTPAVEPLYTMGYTATMPDGTGNTTVRTGLSVVEMTKLLDSTQSTHNTYDDVADSDVQLVSDTDAVNATDLNRTTPAFTSTKTIGLILNDGVTSDVNIATMDDNGGFLDVNPYAEAGWFQNDGGLYVGNQINF
jgi:hypothetical protein